MTSENIGCCSLLWMITDQVTSEKVKVKGAVEGEEV